MDAPTTRKRDSIVFARAHLRETLLELPEVPATWTHVHWAKYDFAKSRLAHFNKEKEEKGLSVFVK
jgi:hypothetical protein